MGPENAVPAGAHHTRARIPIPFAENERAPAPGPRGIDRGASGAYIHLRPRSRFGIGRLRVPPLPARRDPVFVSGWGHPSVRTMKTRSWNLFCTAAALCLAAAFPAVADKATWHHDRSPYRAVFKVVSKPNHAQAGIALSVPICGLGREAGDDLLAFDQKGGQLPVLHLGKGPPNEVLALAQAKPGTSRVYVYFGSKIRAPSRPKGFLPSLLLDVRTLPEGGANSWKQVEALLPKSTRLGRLFVDKIEQAFNPIDSSDACLLVFEGFLKVPKSGAQTFMIVTDDAGYLFVDDKLLVERNGRHWARDALRGEFRKETRLAAGVRPVRFVVVDFGGDMMAVVARWISGRNKFALRPEDFVQPAKTRLIELEGRYRDDPMPAFRYKHLSYMSYAGAYYTETELSTFNKRSAVWRFEDGCELKGATIRRVFPGLRTRKLMVGQKRRQARGLVTFPEVIPPQRSMKNATDFKRYSALILNQNLKDLDVSMLLGYINFLDYRELNEDVIPLCEAIVGKRKAREKDTRRALLTLARAAARNYPEKAGKAYAALIKRPPGKAAGEQLAREYTEFLLYRQRDMDRAGKVIETMARQLSAKNATVIGLRMEWALQQGKVDEARAALDALLGHSDVGRNQQYAAVKGNALRERFYDLLQAGFKLKAWETIHQWSDISPMDRANGNLSLAKSILWQALGWDDGALGELDGAILLDPLLPNLPDVELERGKVFRKAGDTQRANTLFMKIIEEYPNHPAAKEAKGLVK